MYSKYNFVGFSFVGWPVRSVCSLWQQLKSSIFDGLVLSLFHCRCPLVYILHISVYITKLFIAKCYWPAMVLFVWINWKC
jgi:hypothetical protein